MNALWQILLWVLWRHRPAAAVEANLCDIIRQGYAMFADAEVCLAGRAACALVSAALLDAHRKLDFLILLRAHEIAGLTWRGPGFQPCRFPHHSDRTVEDCWRRFRQLVLRFGDVERLARLRATRLLREREQNPLNIIDPLAAIAATLAPPLDVLPRRGRGRRIATSSSRDGGGCASSRGPPHHLSPETNPLHPGSPASGNAPVRAIHRPLINPRTFSRSMANQVRKIGGRAAVLGLTALFAAACASSRPAPISYGRAVPPPPPLATVDPSFRLPPQLDLTSIPFDETNAPVILADQPVSECVPFARTISGVQIWGDAVTWWQQSENKYARSGHPAEGSVLVLRGWNDDKRGHVAVVKEIVSKRVVRVDHANWLHGGEISLNVPVMDVSYDNDWSEVRVWHVPGGYWGGRTYSVQGFIHPYQLNGSAGVISR